MFRMGSENIEDLRTRAGHLTPTFLPTHREVISEIPVRSHLKSLDVTWVFSEAMLPTTKSGNKPCGTRRAGPCSSSCKSSCLPKFPNDIGTGAFSEKIHFPASFRHPCNASTFPLSCPRQQRCRSSQRLTLPHVLGASYASKLFSLYCI